MPQGLVDCNLLHEEKPKIYSFTSLFDFACAQCFSNAYRWFIIRFFSLLYAVAMGCTVQLLFYHTCLSHSVGNQFYDVDLCGLLFMLVARMPQALMVLRS